MSTNNYLDDWEAEKNIELIKKTAEEIWGDDIIFGDIEVLDMPWSEFIWPIQIYSCFNLRLHYERAMLGIEMAYENSNILLNNLTSEPMFECFDTLKPQNLYHNFKVLDRYLLQKMSEEE